MLRVIASNNYMLSYMYTMLHMCRQAEESPVFGSLSACCAEGWQVIITYCHMLHMCRQAEESPVFGSLSACCAEGLAWASHTNSDNCDNFPIPVKAGGRILTITGQVLNFFYQLA